MNTRFKLLAATPLLLGLTGCDWVGTLAKETVIAATPRYGWNSFTLKGQLPENFGIKALMYYGPVNPNNSSCQQRSFASGNNIPRSRVDAQEVKVASTAQSFDFDIPLTFSIGLCSMELDKVLLEIDATFGPKEWQSSYGSGAFYIVRELRPGARNFDNNGELNLNAKCEWSFQESPTHIELGKILSCKGAGAYLQRTVLKGKTINLSVAVIPEEAPYYDNTWIKFENGWKPCTAEEGGWIWCRNPATFKTFKMNGQTCTIYPGCTE